jgi:hypothetical protein
MDVGVGAQPDALAYPANRANERRLRLSRQASSPAATQHEQANRENQPNANRMNVRSHVHQKAAYLPWTAGGTLVNTCELVTNRAAACRLVEPRSVLCADIRGQRVPT